MNFNYANFAQKNLMTRTLENNQFLTEFNVEQNDILKTSYSRNNTEMNNLARKQILKEKLNGNFCFTKFLF